MNPPPLTLYTGRLLFQLAVRIDNRTSVLYLRRDVTHAPRIIMTMPREIMSAREANIALTRRNGLKINSTNLLWDIPDLINVLI